MAFGESGSSSRLSQKLSRSDYQTQSVAVTTVACSARFAPVDSGGRGRCFHGTALYIQQADDRARNPEFMQHAAASSPSRCQGMVSVSNKNDARPNALEALHGVIETHRPLLEEAFAERGSIWLLPAPVRNAISDIPAHVRTLHPRGRLIRRKNPSTLPGGVQSDRLRRFQCGASGGSESLGASRKPAGGSDERHVPEGNPRHGQGRPRGGSL